MELSNANGKASKCGVQTNLWFKQTKHLKHLVG